ncbi:uncharacterized protein GGS25DRAFT_28324 [Hypoxylon fragiforme]|uniref:uncharacterized protein n=1 Tax=Hypoxylon fragiforme TaxID=63214 RepID=UPI0020C67688|nr:uncharacterized protein GGS25DRAFT_28324 [Hypoxylon fragiforme]KAI2613980.1 hypothetical protein GGS25DRAFT_28324 [Hypoxylon fragiforme]
MSGLIPLLLPASAGSKYSFGSSPPEMGRRASLATLSLHSSPPQSLVHRRQQSLPTIRTSNVGTFSPPTSIPTIPSTSVEWKKAVDEVKRKYLNRKYRACSARCCEILDNVKDTSTVEPVYLIYIHFYAASSFELCARPLSSSSTYRTRLLRDAQTHYNKAEALIQNTEEGMTRRKRSGSISSTTSSPQSPGLSPSVRSSISSTTLSSPRTSVCSTDDGNLSKSMHKAGVKAKKKVSFSGLNDLIEFQPEPYIRPDSPTLGWEDDFFPQQCNTSIPIFPVPKNKPIMSLPMMGSEESPEPQPEVTDHAITKDHQSAAEEPNPSEDKFDLDAFLQTRSRNKISAQLSALRSQVCFHRDGIDALLAEPEDEPPATPALPINLDISTPSTPVDFIPPRLIRANTLPIEAESDPATPGTPSSLRGSFASLLGLDSPRAIIRPASVASNVRCTDEGLKQRIERLRAGGWQRKRFDNRRYEALREQVLCELGA